MLQAVMIVTRTMTTMATAVMDTDHMDMDTERIRMRHTRLHTASGGGNVLSSRH